MIHGMLLTQDQGKILGPVAKLLGYILNIIFNILNTIGIPNVGLAIIIFTIIIYIALLPLTIKQQKFSKLSAIMGPELNAVKEKYKGKTDQVSMQKQNEEMNLVYKNTEYHRREAACSLSFRCLFFLRFTGLFTISPLMWMW